MKKVGIIYICRGRYILFWKDFYLSCEKYFLPEFEKHYFVFTDDEIVYDEENPRVRVYLIKRRFDRINDLLRPDIFSKAEDELKRIDYVYFFNANLKFVKNIGIKYLPESPDELVVISPPSFYGKKRKDDLPGMNTDSLVFISDNDNIIYIAGDGNGASSDLFLRLVKESVERTQEVFSKEIVITFHNESHPNKYILDPEVRIIPQK
ncbi:MAG: hypothetical protein LBU57_08760 [Dysgonamonadaceae bacterium]|jgi:hypothetical protein|nr:hypothetical protein [Dysgonamonadaceae bacterium]